MAGPLHARGSRQSLFDAQLSPNQDLPSGSCNYRDLSVGSRAPLCGCQRFYLNSSQRDYNGTAERGWCFCGHHACFHNAFTEKRAAIVREQELGFERDNVTAVIPSQAATTFPRAPSGLGIQAGAQAHSPSINASVWQALNDFARLQDGDGASVTTSKLPSTAAPSVVDDPRLSSRRGGPSSLPIPRSMGPPISVPPTTLPKPTEDYSATEVATPSIAGTPDFRALAVESGGVPANPEPASARSNLGHDEIRHARGGLYSAGDPHPLGGAASVQDLREVMRTYSQRLEALENLSFSQIPYEEIQDRFDLFDGRVLDLERWRIEQEKQALTEESDQGPGGMHRRLLPNESGSFASDASFDRNAAIHTEAVVLATLASNAETHPRIDALESRVADLENVASPSFASPWQVQVVLLPWSRQLKGIWFSLHEATQHLLRSATQPSDEWTAAQSVTNPSFQSAGAWTTQSIEAWANEAQEWLSPKACGPSGAVFQRLASRGLVQDVIFSAPDARHVLQMIGDAFPKWLQPHQAPTSDCTDRYRGLCESFIPLRKVRKSSRLRFLDPPEMVTSAIWTACFLDSSVFMKTGNGQRRLYITTADAYTQPATGKGLDWNQVRELPRSSNLLDEPTFAQCTAAEDCWRYHQNLDVPISLHSSFDPSQWSTRSQMTDAVSQPPSQSAISLWSESQVPRPKSTSFPNSGTVSARSPSYAPPRPVASFGTANKHPNGPDIEVEGMAKRRRISLSPEVERRGVNFTPRWSREPPSPFTSELAIENKSQGTGIRMRGTTPFAYATPHSNIHDVERIELMIGDGDTEVNTDVLGPLTDVGEEEWEGMDDENEGEELKGGALDGASLGNGGMV